LLLRGIARQNLGEAGATADIDRGRAADPNNPDVIMQAAQAALISNRPADAVRILRHPAVDHEPLLLAIRAETLAELRDLSGAKEDLANAVQGLPDAVHPDETRLAAASAAIELKDVDVATRLLDSLSERVRDGPQPLVLRGRLAFLGGLEDEGERFFRAAAEREPSRAWQYLGELAGRMLRARRPTDAARIFEDAGLEDLPDEALREYGSALFHAGALVRAQRLVDDLATKGPLPDWALALATDLAVRQEDVDAAIQRLLSLVNRGPQPAHVRLSLARLLIESGRAPDALPYLQALTREDLPPEERLQTAALLRDSGQVDDALAAAFSAYRLGPEEPRVQAGFAAVFVTTRITTPWSASEVGPDTYVRLREERGRQREYVIYATPPFSPFRHEISVDQAASEGLLGKHVGEVIGPERTSWDTERWAVEEILPAPVFVARDILDNFRTRFPGRPFFARQFSIGDGTSVRDLLPLIGTIEERRTQTERLFALLRTQILPLGFVSKVVGVSIGALMQQMSADPRGVAPLAVEWFDRRGQLASREALVGATEVVVTRSAMETAFRLGILDEIATQFTLVAPMTLQSELRAELAESHRTVLEGRAVATTEGSLLQIQQMQPGDASLIEAEQLVQEMLRWIETVPRLEPRPLEVVQPAGSPQEEGRDTIGKSSFDAVALAESRSSVLYADDLGLRKYSVSGTRAASFSTVALIRWLAEQGTMTAEARDEALLSLAVSNYKVIEPSLGLLVAATRRTPVLKRAELQRVFGLLGGPSMSLGESVQIAARVVREVAFTSVQLVSDETVIELSLDGLRSRWPLGAVVNSFSGELTAIMALAPVQLGRLLAAVRGYLTRQD